MKDGDRLWIELMLVVIIVNLTDGWVALLWCAVWVITAIQLAFATREEWVKSRRG